MCVLSDTVKLKRLCTKHVCQVFHYPSSPTSTRDVSYFMVSLCDHQIGSPGNESLPCFNGTYVDTNNVVQERQRVKEGGSSKISPIHRKLKPLKICIKTVTFRLFDQFFLLFSTSTQNCRAKVIETYRITYHIVSLSTSSTSQILLKSFRCRRDSVR